MIVILITFAARSEWPLWAGPEKAAEHLLFPRLFGSFWGNAKRDINKLRSDIQITYVLPNLKNLIGVRRPKEFPSAFSEQENKAK